MTVFYRKYRPQKFADLFGQRIVVETLLGQLKAGKFSHGYLFSGPKGTGKTSTARIFAKAVNCLSYGKKSNREGRTQNFKFGEPCDKCVSCLAVIDGSHLDLIEIDAASNRLIDDVRDLREKIKLAPISSWFKVYIIDEAHMLTKEAFNALLKTLEEPPAHAILILCTTEPSRLPPTIISRVQRFNFSRANEGELSRAIEKIAKSEGLKVAKEAVLAIAKAADGSFRDAVSYLDQVSTSKRTIFEKDIEDLVVFSGWGKLYDFVQKLLERNLKEVVLTVEKISLEGGDLSFFTREMILFLEKLMFIKIGISPSSEELESEQLERMENLAQKITLDQVQSLIKLILVAEGEMKLYPLPQIPLVLAVCRYCLSERTQNAFGSHNERQVLVDKGSLKNWGAKREVVYNLPDKSKKKQDIKIKKKANAAASQQSLKSIDNINKYWKQFLEKVRKVNTQVMAILRSTKPLQFDGTKLTLAVFYRFHKEKLEEPKITMMLEENLKEVVGRQIALKFVLAQKETRLPKAVSESDVVDVKMDDLAKIASEIFSK